MMLPLRLRALTVSAMAIACALIPARVLSQTSFSEHTVYTSNSADLTILAHGDFNNDGREDFIVQQSSSSATAKLLFLSNGNGTYDAPITLPSIQANGGSVADNQGTIAVGDFNHDGNLDYAELDILNKQVLIWMGHGDGTFTNSVALATNAGPMDIAAADLNHDNNTDLIVVSSSGGYANIQVWISQGDSVGSFNGGQQITSGVIVPFLITTGDFDGDGKPDLALVDEEKGPTTVQVWYGDGAGHLGSPTQLSDPNYWDRWNLQSIGDIDGNGTSDLVMAQTNGSGGSGPIQYYPRITVFKGNTNRTLSLTTISTPGGCPTANIQIADYNGDGLNDLLYEEIPCSSSGTPNLVVNPATSKGVFSGSEQVVTSANMPYPDGWPMVNVKSTQGTKPDVAFTEYTQAGTTSGSMRLSLLENSSSGTYPGCGTGSYSEGINVCMPSGSTANSPVTFSLSASGPTPMRTVAVWADGQKVSEQLTHAFSNYSFLDQSVTLSAGTHNITVYGTGWDNTLQQKNFTLTVGSSSGGTCGAPSSAGVHVCSPVNGSTVQSPVQVSAAATITGTLARMEIWVDGTKMYTETTSTSFNTSVNLANGYHRFDIYAVNTAGTKWETTVYATVGASSSCAAPSSYGVHVCSPVNGSTVNSPVQATASATISGSIARMEVWVDGVKKFSEYTSTSMSTSIALGSGNHRFDFYAVNTAGTKWETTVYATVP